MNRHVLFVGLITFFIAGCVTYKNSIQKVISFGKGWYSPAICSEGGVSLRFRPMGDSELGAISYDEAYKKFHWVQYRIDNSTHDSVTVSLDAIRRYAATRAEVDTVLATTGIEQPGEMTTETIHTALSAAGSYIVGSLLTAVAGVGIIIATGGTGAAVASIAVPVVGIVLVINTIRQRTKHYYDNFDSVKTLKDRLLLADSQAELRISPYQHAVVFVPQRESLSTEAFHMIAYNDMKVITYHE